MKFTAAHVRDLTRPSVPVAEDSTGATGMGRDTDGLSVLLELARSAPPMPDDYAAFYDAGEDRSPGEAVQRHAQWAVNWGCAVFRAAQERLNSLASAAREEASQAAFRCDSCGQAGTSLVVPGNGPRAGQRLCDHCYRKHAAPCSGTRAEGGVA